MLLRWRQSLLFLHYLDMAWRTILSSLIIQISYTTHMLVTKTL
uniref:Uncharacterized protein n=1 Tax=Picea sitchensis TaxID=3332 RepID=A9NLI1_PICSI|nr:unknown [Picea sitchensis]